MINSSSGFQATIGGKKMRSKKPKGPRTVRFAKGPASAKTPMAGKVTAKGQMMVPPNALGASGLARKKKKPVMR